MPDDTKAVVQAFVRDVQNDGNVEATGDYIAAGFVEHWNTVNLLGALQQMGAAPGGQT